MVARKEEMTSKRSNADKPRKMSKKEKEQEKSRLGRVERAAYNYRKEQIMEREKENDRMIYLFRSNGNWWKIAGKSVLYYTKIVAPRLKKEVKVWVDRDFASPSMEGIVQIRDLKQFIDEVESLNYKVKPESNENFMAVELGFKVTQEELNMMRKEEARRWEMAEKMLMPEVRWPGLKSEVLELTRILWESVRKLDAPAQMNFGNRIMDKVNDLMTLLFFAARGEMSPREALVGMMEDVTIIESFMMVMTSLRLFDAQKNFNVARILAKIKTSIKREEKKIVNKEKE